MARVDTRRQRGGNLGSWTAGATERRSAHTGAPQRAWDTGAPPFRGARTARRFLIRSSPFSWPGQTYQAGQHYQARPVYTTDSIRASAGLPLPHGSANKTHKHTPPPYGGSGNGSAHLHKRSTARADNVAPAPIFKCGTAHATTKPTERHMAWEKSCEVYSRSCSTVVRPTRTTRQDARPVISRGKNRRRRKVAREAGDEARRVQEHMHMSGDRCQSMTQTCNPKLIRSCTSRVGC